MKHELLFAIVGAVAVIIAALVSYNIIEEKRIVALSQSIETATARGIDPVAVRCAYATTNDTICIVYASKKQEFVMDTIEIKKAENGFVVVVQEDDIKEYVFMREQHLIKFIKEYFKTE